MNYVQILEEIQKDLFTDLIKEFLNKKGITHQDISTAIKEAKADKKAAHEYSWVKYNGGCEMGQL